MPDELYSIVVDYLTKGGKLPTIVMPPQVVVVGSSGGAVGDTKSSVASTIASAVVASMVGGLFGAFAKTKAIAKLPKKKLGVETAKVFRNKEQIMVDKKVMAQSKAMRNDLKATAIKLDVTQKQLAAAQQKIQVRETVSPVRETPATPVRERPAAPEKIQPQTIQLTPARLREVALPSMGKREREFASVREVALPSMGKREREFASVNAEVKVPKVNFAPIVAPMSPQQQKTISMAVEKKGYDNSKANTVIGKQNSLGEVTQ